jgi:hypothetical protein
VGEGSSGDGVTACASGRVEGGAFVALAGALSLAQLDKTAAERIAIRR